MLSRQRSQASILTTVAVLLSSVCACTKAPITAAVTPGSGSLPEIGTATLSWEPPRRNLDGSAIRELAGYYIYYGTSPSSLNSGVKIPDPYATTYMVDKLAPGTYYFSIVAFTTTGIKGSASPMVSKTIR